MSNKSIFCLIALGIFQFACIAQKYDRYWMTGYSLSASPPFLGNIIDLESDPPSSTSEIVGFETIGCVGTMCDFDGNILFYTNGSRVLDRNHTIIENGDSLNWGYLHKDPNQAYPQSNTLIILPSTKALNTYHILHIYFDTCAVSGVHFKLSQVHRI